MRILFFLFVLLLGPAAEAEDLSAPSVAATLTTLLSQQTHIVIAGEQIDVENLKDIYEPRNHVPAWLDETGTPTPAAKTAIELLGNAGQDGLNPKAYHFDQIAAVAKPANSVEAASFDLLLSDGFGTYLHDLRVGRTPVGPDRDASYAEPFDRAFAISAVIALSPEDLRRFVEGLNPVMPDYKALKMALTVVKQQQAQETWPVLPEGPSLKPGMTSPDVVILRQRLGLAMGAKPQIYDKDIANAVKAFQEWHAIKDDGAVGKDTRIALNMPAAERVAEIVASMERLRWLPRSFDARYVMVDVGGFWLRLVDNNQLTLQLPVIVGTTERETPTLQSQITNVIINPNWTVPPTIIRKDILPKLRANPGYLATRGISLYQRTDNGLEEVNPTHIDWKEKSSLGDYVLRQPAGDENPLGHYKFNFPNPYSIYLHDTPEQKKFDAALRSFSSGCVRVQDAQKLAETILGEEDLATPEKIAALRADEKTHWIKLNTPIPVYIIYLSVWLDPQGHIIFGPDLYKKDVRLAAQLMP